MFSGQDALFIRLHNVEVPIHIGYYDFEHARPQPVIFNIELRAEAAPRYGEDVTRFEDVIDYGKIHGKIMEMSARTDHVTFVESLAEELVCFCLMDPRVQAVRVRVEKPKIFAEATGAGIELVRTRK
jgi:7,8-dihydroneopterin aldolase/epimerase/oxygenase